MSPEDVLMYAAIASIFGLVAGIVYSAVRIAVDTERAERLEHERDKAWSDGFASGADMDAKTRRIGERASRLQR